MEIKAIQMLEFINNRLSNIEKNINRIDEKLDYSLALQRNHLIRIKNGEDIDDNMILMGRPYNDLDPQKSFEIYSNPNMDFLVLDVTHKDFAPMERIAGSIHIPFEDLNTRYAEVQNKTTPILIVSEKGLRSIQACEMLIKKGFFNLNNVSGGYLLWPGFKASNNQQGITG